MHLQGIEMKLTRFFSTMVILLLSGCTLGFDATFEDLSLLREEPADIVGQYSLPGREAPGRPLACKAQEDELSVGAAMA